MKTLLAIDISHCFWSAYHATADQEISAAFERTLEMVWKLEPHTYDKVVLAEDRPPYRRKALLVSYKANRDVPAELAIEQFRRVKAKLGAEYPIAGADGYEADDTIATLCHQARGEYEVTIATNDKDLFQLVGPGVVVKSTRTKETYDEAKVFEKMGVAPTQIRQWLALMGDKSDNVPGVPGIGPVKAAWLLNTIGDLEAIRKAVEEDDERIKPAMLEALKVAFEAGTVSLAFSLVGLDYDVPVNLNELEVKKVAEEPEGSFDEEDDDVPDEIGGAPQRKSEPPPRQSAAIVVARPEAITTYELGLEPPDLREAYKLAKAMHSSRLYTRFPTPESVFAVIIRGREMGIGALTALDNFHMINGKPTMAAVLMQARAESHPKCSFLMCTESTPEKCTFVTKHVDHPKETTLTYTMQQAQDAGLIQQNPSWKKYPSEMLRKTAAVKLIRLVYPSCVAGLHCPEELGGESD